MADAAFLGAAWFLAVRAPQPMDGPTLIALVACVAGAGVAGVIPFLTDYARRQDDALDQRQRSLEALTTTTAAAIEQLSIAAAGLHEIVELAQRNLKQADQLPHRLHEKVAEFDAKLSNSLAEEKEELERELVALRASESDRLEATADKVARAAADWGKAEIAAQKHLSAAKSVLAEFDQRIGAALAAATAVSAAAPPAGLDAAPPPAPALAPVAEGIAAPTALRKRAPKKAANPPEAALVLEGIAGPAAEEFSGATEASAPAISISADGATRLLVTAYIGIGNRLFIRGDGPGLSWDEGVPLQFVSIGKWRWETTEPHPPIRFKLYKNDQIECTSLRAEPLEPARQLDVTATF